MAVAPTTFGDAGFNDAWEAARRRRLGEAEARVNLLRVVAVGVFYLVHLLHHWAATRDIGLLQGLELQAGGILSDRFHLAVTCIVVAWVMLAAVVHAAVRDGQVSRWLSVAATLCDVVLLTATLLLTSGAASPLLTGYFLIIIMSGLRLELRLVWDAAGASIAGYLVVLGCTRWPQGLLVENPLPEVPRYQQLMVIAALAIAGVVVGQCVRHARQLAGDVTRGAGNGAAA
jgi:hypothetical protein